MTETTDDWRVYVPCADCGNTDAYKYHNGNRWMFVGLYWSDGKWRCKTCTLIYRKAGPSRRVAKRKNRISKNGGSHTNKQWLTLLSHYCPDGKCLCCGKNAKLSKDHVVEIWYGGLDSIENIQPLCRSCNSKKNRWKMRSIDYRPDGGEFARNLMGYETQGYTAKKRGEE